MSGHSILLLEPDEAEGDRIAEILRHAGHAVDVVPDATDLVQRAAAHDMLLLDLPHEAQPAGGTAPARAIRAADVEAGPEDEDGAAADDQSAVAGADEEPVAVAGADEEPVAPSLPGAVGIVHEIRANAATAPLPILCFTQTAEVDERIRLLESGADDVIARPYDARELVARVDALAVRLQVSGGTAPARPGTAAVERPRRIVAFLGAKGGVGVTTLAVNVAVALADRQPGQVALVDLALPIGQVPVHLDLTPHHDVTDLAAGIDEASVRGAAEHVGPLDIFCLPDDAETADRLTGSGIVAALDELRAAYQLVIVDGGSSLDSRTLAFLEAADRIVLVTLPEIPSLRALVSVEQILGERRLGDRAVHVVNHLFAHEPLKRTDIEETLGTSIAIEMPHHDLLFGKAVNEGVPVVRSAPRSEAAERLANLASIVAGISEPEEEPDAPRRRFRLLRRGA